MSNRLLSFEEVPDDALAIRVIANVLGSPAAGNHECEVFGGRSRRQTPGWRPNNRILSYDPDAAARYARFKSTVQLLPYMGGIVLVAALVVLILSIHAVAREGHKALTETALVSTAAFASLIFFNYVVQPMFLAVLAALANIRA